jgi:MYXO-CTERM domain-containing protein
MGEPVTRAVIRLLGLVLVLHGTSLSACDPARREIGRIQRAAGSGDGQPLPDRSDRSVHSAGDTRPEAERRELGLPCGEVPDVGCCDGETLWWCESGILVSLPCSARPHCGWSTSGFHDCNTSGMQDPKGAYLKDCLPRSVPKTDGIAPDGGGPCAGLGREGCCAGNLLRYCERGQLVTVDCGPNPACGWVTGNPGQYDCGTEGLPGPDSAPPLACPGPPPDGQPEGPFDSGAEDGTDAAGDRRDSGGKKEGCTCTTTAASPGSEALLLLGVLALVGLWRRARALAAPARNGDRRT